MDGLVEVITGRVSGQGKSGLDNMIQRKAFGISRPRGWLT
jgi:hypothetical protein